jgi:Ca2+-transporting ATPase
MSSYRLVAPIRKHQKTSSIATLTNSAEGYGSLDGTEPDNNQEPPTPIRDVLSDTTSMTMTSPTHTHFDDTSVNAPTEISQSRRQLLGQKGNSHADGAKRKRGKGDSEGNGVGVGMHEIHHLAQDDAIDPTPFKYKPFQLASLVDAKDFNGLDALGGVERLLAGLGTNCQTGLSKRALQNESNGTPGSQGDGRPGAGTRIDAPQQHDRRGDDGGGGVPGIVVTAPEGDAHSKREDTPHEFSDDDDPAFFATLEQRRRVYGRNVLPHRRVKTLLQLMYAAWKDKVLVRMFSQHV